MPPRKSDSSKVATGDEGSVAGVAAGTSTGPNTSSKKEDGINIEDLNLPKSIVTRLAKGVLPPNTQIQGNAMLALSKSATVFVNYLSAQANEYAQNANRKTIAPADVFKALEELEFDFTEQLEAELAKFNEIQTDKRNTYRKKVAADKAAGVKSGSSPVGERRESNGVVVQGEGEGEGGGRGEAEHSGQPAAKRPRRDADSNPDAARDEVEDASDGLDEGDLGEGEGEDGGEEGEEDPDVDEVEEEEEEDGVEVDDPPEDTLEEPEERDEGGDEALDNGDDSD